MNILNKNSPIPMKCIWDQSETILNPMQKKKNRQNRFTIGEEIVEHRHTHTHTHTQIVSRIENLVVF